MLAFPQLAGARGKYFVANIGTTPELPVWGDGLVDELSFLIPSLASRLRATTVVPVGPATYLRGLLIAHLCLAARHLPQAQQDQPQPTPNVVLPLPVHGTTQEELMTAGALKVKASRADTNNA